MAGFFSDPVYGGNRDKIAWKMIGFPGLPLPTPTRSMPIATSVMSPSRNLSQTSLREGEAAMATKLKDVDAVVIGLGFS